MYEMQRSNSPDCWRRSNSAWEEWSSWRSRVVFADYTKVVKESLSIIERIAVTTEKTGQLRLYYKKSREHICYLLSILLYFYCLNNILLYYIFYLLFKLVKVLTSKLHKKQKINFSKKIVGNSRIFLTFIKQICNIHNF